MTAKTEKHKGGVNPRPISMSADDLASAASTVYGEDWQTPLARDTKIALRTVQRWKRDGIPLIGTAEYVRRFLEERRLSRVADAPAEDRDEACYDALAPGVRALIAAAADSGWHPAEAVTAVFAVVVDEMADSAGAPAALAMVRQAIDVLSERARAGS